MWCEGVCGREGSANACETACGREGSAIVCETACGVRVCVGGRGLPLLVRQHVV